MKLKKTSLKTAGVLVFLLILTFTMAACDMVGNNSVADTTRNVAESSETGELEIIMNEIKMEEVVDKEDGEKEFEEKKSGIQGLLFNRFEDFQLKFYIEYQNDSSINFTKTISIDDADILEDDFGDIGYSVIFTALRESNYDVTITLTGYNVNTEERVTIADGTTEAMVIEGMKRDVRLEIQQATGGLNITVDQFPSEETGGEIMEKVNVKLLDLDGETVREEMDFDYDVADQNLLVEGLFPAYYTIQISWDGHGTIDEEIQERVVPGKVTDVPITLFGSQLTVGVDWMAEPVSPTNVRVEQNDEGFLISWDAVDNADRYNVLRKRTPYTHAHFGKVGEVVHTSMDRHEFQYEVLKPELFDEATYEFQVVSVREHPEKDYDLTSEPASPDDQVEPAEYTVTLEQEPDVNAILSGDGDYEAGDTVSLNVSDWDQDYEFVNWTSDQVTINNPDSPTDASFIMPDEDVTATANFELLYVVEPIEPVNMGTSCNYVILTKTGITNVAISDITGDMGVSPVASTAITGFDLELDSSGEFSTSDQVDGRIYAADYAEPTPSNLTTAVNDMEEAYTEAAGRTADYTNVHGGSIGGETLEPGVYEWNTAVSIDDDVTLNAEGDEDAVWIFQISGQLTQAANTQVILTDGTQAKNVFWQVTETVAIEADADFKGIVLGQTNITLESGASVTGKLLAQTEVTLIQNTITGPE